MNPAPSLHSDQYKMYYMYLLNSQRVTVLNEREGAG